MIFYQHLFAWPMKRNDFVYEMLRMSVAESVDPMERKRYYLLMNEFSNEKG